MAQGTPEIPGFQPLGIRGGGELGIWIEARQVRLDRRVLLKVLPASESHLESEFLREVRAMVQLDGRGVLRVIEEGQAGKARFVALDEAGSLRPEPGMLAPNEVVQLAAMLLSLHLEVAELGIRPGSIPVESLRRLPAGGFVVCELGRTGSQAGEVDAEQTRAAISETLRRWCRHLDLESPVEPLIEELRQASLSLPQLLQKWQQQVPSSTGTPALRTWPKRPGSASAVAFLFLALVLIAGLSTGVFEPGSEPVSNSVIPEVPNISKVPNDTPDPDLPDPRVPSSVAEGAGDRDPQAEAGASGSRENSSPPVSESRSESSAVKVVAPTWDQVILEEQQQAQWKMLQEQVDPGFLPADRLLLAETSGRDRDLAALLRALLWQELRLLSREGKKFQEECQKYELSAAASTLARLKSCLPGKDLTEFEALLGEARENLEKQEKLWADFQRTALEESLANGNPVLDRGDRDGVPLTRYDRLKQDLIRELEETGALEQRVLQNMRATLSSEAPNEILLEGGGTIKGRLLEVKPGRLVVKPVGRKDPRSLRWSEIDRSWADQWLIPEDGPVGDADQARLSLVWGGLKGVDSGAVYAGLSPLLQGAISVTREQRKTEGLQRLQKWTEAREWDRLRSEVEALVSQFSTQGWTSSEKRILERGWISPLLESGPRSLNLFPGAAEVRWQPVPETGDFELDVYWDSGAGIRQDWSGGTGGDLREARGGGVLIRGEISLVTPLLFEGQIRVQLEGVVTVREKPNLNLIFWSGSDVPVWFGLGFRPPERSSYTSAGETVLLPAHGIMKVPDMALPDTESGESPLPFPLPVMGPRLTPGQLLQVELEDGSEGTRMSLNGRRLLELPAEDRPRRGGLSFQTYDSPVMLRALRVRGGVSGDQWQALLMGNAKKVLWKRP